MIVVLNRAFRLCTRLFFTAAGLAIGTVFILMALSVFVKGTGGPALRQFIRSDGFFPWPVAAMFSLMMLAPWFIGVGVVGAIVGSVLRRMLFRDSQQVTGEVVAISQTGTTVNSRPQMRLRVRVGGREIALKALVDLANIPRTGDTVRLLVSRADPSFVRYAGLMTQPAAASTL